MFSRKTPSSLQHGDRPAQPGHHRQLHKPDPSPEEVGEEPSGHQVLPMLLATLPSKMLSSDRGGWPRSMSRDFWAEQCPPPTPAPGICTHRQHSPFPGAIRPLLLPTELQAPLEGFPATQWDIVMSIPAKQQCICYPHPQLYHLRSMNISQSVQLLSRVRLCNPMDCSTPGFPVHHQLLELAQTHVHRVGDAIQPSHPLSSPSSPALNLSQHQGLCQQVSSSHQVAKVLELQLQHQSFQ